MISLETLERWLTIPAENEHLEFKEAREKYNDEEVLKYSVAFANEGGGYLVLGVTDAPPRNVVGTKAFVSETKLNKLKLTIVEQLGIRVDAQTIEHHDGRVLIFDIPSRLVGSPLDFKGAYLMRSGESVVAMTPDRLKEIFAESSDDWFSQAAKENLDADDVIALLDTQAYFDLLEQPYPSTQSEVLQRFDSEYFILATSEQWTITNLGALLLAKDMEKFSSDISLKAPRFVLYDGAGKINTSIDVQGKFGYAVGFERLVNFVNESAPHNRILEETIRREIRMFPDDALRELIANALVHQDFSVRGASVMIEMYMDRVEISSPGKPPIDIFRFIDGYQSRNERLARVMRRLGICEEKGSGIDKVIDAVEVFQLPAPEFRFDGIRTTAILFSHKDFSAMSRSERIRACYQHCCLLHVSRRSMTNTTLRRRFGLADDRVTTASAIIAATKQEGLIKPRNQSQAASTRYAAYMPFWG